MNYFETNLEEISRSIQLLAQIFEYQVSELQVEEKDGNQHIQEGKRMPLSMVAAGEVNTIKKVGGKEETRRFLENLGFVVGGAVSVVSEINGSLIVNVKDSRVAIGKEMAAKILI